MWKLKYDYKQDGEVKIEYMKDLGNHNKLPEPMEKISHKEYFDNIFSYLNNYYESKQIFDNKSNLIGEFKVMYNHEAGYAVYKNYIDSKYEFYKVGCKHDYEETKLDKCLYEYKCKKCGLEQVIDSSD